MRALRSIGALSTLALACGAEPADDRQASDAGADAAIDAPFDGRASDDAILRHPDPRRPWSGVVAPIAAVEALQFRVDDRIFATADLATRYFVLDTRTLGDGEHWLGVDVAQGTGTSTRWARFVVANGDVASLPPLGGGFVEVGADIGLSTLDATPLPRRSVASAGGIAADFDGDRAMDLVAWGTDGAARLLRQDAPWRFTAGPTLATGVSAAGAADLDADGDPDLIVAGDDVQLFRNDHGTFVDVTALAGISAVGGGTYRGVTFADLDLDGLEDVLIARMDCGGGANLVLHNEGALRFSDVASALGLDAPAGATYAFSADLAPDDGLLHVWTFHEGCRPVATEHVTLAQTDGLPIASAPIALPEGFAVSPMGSAWLDADGDDRLDHWVSGDIVSPLWLGPRFDVGASAQVGLDAFAPLGIATSQWSLVTFDADLDGRSDVYAVHDPSDPASDDSGASDALYWQRGPGAFRDVAPAAGLAGHRACRSAFGADLDADGDIDLITGCRDGVRVFRNDLVAPGRARTVRLIGTLSPADGVHAWIRSEGGRVVMVRGGGQPYAGGTSAPGMRGDEALDVHWPSGLVQHVYADDHGFVLEPRVVQLAARRVPPGAAPVEVTIDPALIGAARDSVIVTLKGATWDRPPAPMPDGRVHGTIHVPSVPGTITLQITIGDLALAVHPRIYVRAPAAPTK